MSANPLLDAAIVTLREAEHYTQRRDGWVEAGVRLVASLQPLRDAIQAANPVPDQVPVPVPLVPILTPWSCRACAHAYMEPDSDLVCGHPDSGVMGLFVGNGHGPDAPGGHCGPERTKFEQHPLRTPEGNLICRGSQKELGRD